MKIFRSLSFDSFSNSWSFCSSFSISYWRSFILCSIFYFTFLFSLLLIVFISDSTFYILRSRLCILFFKFSISFIFWSIVLSSFSYKLYLRFSKSTTNWLIILSYILWSYSVMGRLHVGQTSIFFNSWISFILFLILFSLLFYSMYSSFTFFLFSFNSFS